MKTYFIIAIAIVLASLSVLALTDDNSEKREGQSYFLTPEGKLQQQEGQFIDTEFQQYKVDGLTLFKVVNGTKMQIQNASLLLFQ